MWWFLCIKIHDILFVFRVISMHLQDKGQGKKHGVVSTQTKNKLGQSLKTRLDLGRAIA